MEPYPEVLALAKLHLLRFVVFILLFGVLALVLLAVQGRKGRWYALMTGTWVVINALVAAALHYHLGHPPHLQLPSVLGHIAFWMGFNLILDAFYCLCALVLYWLVHATDGFDELYFGFGNAVLVQGLGLLLIDLWFYRQLVLLI